MSVRGHLTLVTFVAATTMMAVALLHASAWAAERDPWYQYSKAPATPPPASRNAIPRLPSDATPYSAPDYPAPMPRKSLEQQVQEQFQSVLYQLHYTFAKDGGCWKSDNEIWLDPTIGQKPNEAAMQTKGTILWADPPGKGAIVQSADDFCMTDNATGITKLHEYYCAVTPQNCKPNPKCKDPSTCPNPKICVGTKAEFIATCKTGTECKNGACVPISGNAAWDGCFVGQAPFLDTNGNGIPDACACPEGTFPKDTNKDGNTDTCADRGEICGVSDADKTKLGVTVKAKGLEDGGWTLSDYCSTPFEVTSIVCSDTLKSKGVMSTSKKSCNPGQICQKGSCIDTNSDLCDGSSSNKDPKIKGWVTINASTQLWDKCGDKCATFKSDPIAYNTCLQNPGKYADVAENILCTSPVDSSVQYYPTPCAMTEYCSDGVCKPKPNSGGNSGGADKQPYDPKKPPTGKDGNNPAPDPGDTSTAPDNKPCTIELQCSEPTDSTHPVMNGFMLMGDPYISGKTTTDLTCGGSILPSLSKDVFDTCFWKEEELLPVLIQYGCIDPKKSPVSSVGPCSWSQNEACRWPKTELEKAEAKVNPGKYGVCYKNVPKPKVTAKPATATTPGKITGTNSFGVPVDDTDICVPSQGKKTIKKWKVVDSPEGAQAYYVTCPDQNHCSGGVCVPDYCLANKGKIDDKDPCTDDTCKDDIESIFNLPVSVDDNDNCTLDKCTNVGGKASITHTPIESQVCKLSKLCTEKPNDPQCVTPTLDCSKTPEHPSCKKLPAGLDCTKTPNDPACKIKIDCTKTPDDPLCKPPKGGFSCDDPANKDDPQCKTSQDYCYDDDASNDASVIGTAVVFPGTPQQKSATDTCVDFDGKQFTAVLQVTCGPNTTFFYKKTACPTPTSKGCINGICEPK